MGMGMGMVMMMVLLLGATSDLYHPAVLLLYTIGTLGMGIFADEVSHRLIAWKTLIVDIKP